MRAARSASAGVPRVAFLFTTDGDRIVGPERVADPERLDLMAITVRTGSTLI